MNLELLKWEIIEKMDSSWSDLEKIRFAYIYSGKVLKKHTEFFLTVEGKMKYRPLTPKKLDKIYENKNKFDEWDKLICKSACNFLKSIFDEIGINSAVIETIDHEKIPGMKNEIHHYFLCASDMENNYFMSPTADYAYIQSGMETKHFATDISFLITGPGGKKIKYYKSEEEIPHKNLNSVELKKIDSKIGYLTKYSKYEGETKEIYVDEIMRESKDLYIDYLAENTTFFNMIFPLDENKKIVKSIINSTEEDWFKLINNICFLSGRRVCELLNIKYSFNKVITNKDELVEWSNYISGLYNSKDFSPRDVIYKNPNLLFQKSKSLCNTILKYYESEKRLSTLKKETLSFRNTLIRMTREIGKHFIDDKIVREPNEQNDYVSSHYLNAKFSTLFPYIFNCNEGLQNSFNNLSYSEQIELIKYIIMMMFSELDDKVLLKDDVEPMKVKPLLRRINIYSIKEKKGNDYGCYFSINDASKNLGNSPVYWYLFDIKNNTFTKTTPANIVVNCSKNGKYEILSNRLKTIIDRLEFGDVSHVTKKR